MPPLAPPPEPTDPVLWEAFANQRVADLEARGDHSGRVLAELWRWEIQERSEPTKR